MLLQTRNKNIQPSKSIIKRTFFVSDSDKIRKSALYKFINCKKIEIIFDKEKCFTNGKDDKFQIFEDSNKRKQIGIDYYGNDDKANWPNFPLINQGKSVFVCLTTGNVSF